MIASQVYFQIIAMFLLTLKQEISAKITNRGSDVHIHFSFTEKHGAENQEEMMKEQSVKSAEKHEKRQNKQKSKLIKNWIGVRSNNDYSSSTDNSDKNDAHIHFTFSKKYGNKKKNLMMSDDDFSDYKDDDTDMVTVVRTKPHLHFGECSQASSL